MEEKRSINKNLVAILGALLLLAIVATIYFGFAGNKKAKEAARVQAELDSLGTIKTELVTDLEELNTQYESIAIENDSLKGSLENAKEIISNKDNQIWKIQNNATKDINQLKSEIETLQVAKEDLVLRITDLETENSSLKNENAELLGKLTVSEQQNTRLQNQVGDLQRANTLLEKKTAQLANSAFKASAMQVEMMRKNDKASIKSRKIRKFSINFDLVDVPEEYQGPQTIYLYITDANGVPVKPTDASVKINDGTVIEAQSAKKVNLESSQRMEFFHELEDRIQPGYYIASIYSEKGLLGSTMFKLI